MIVSVRRLKTYSLSNIQVYNPAQLTAPHSLNPPKRFITQLEIHIRLGNSPVSPTTLGASLLSAEQQSQVCSQSRSRVLNSKFCSVLSRCRALCSAPVSPPNCHHLGLFMVRGSSLWGLVSPRKRSLPHFAGHEERPREARERERRISWVQRKSGKVVRQRHFPESFMAYQAF